MIGTLITIGTGVYVGLYLAGKGCTYNQATAPLKRTYDMLQRNCCPCTVEPEVEEENKCTKSKDTDNEQS